MQGNNSASVTRRGSLMAMAAFVSTLIRQPLLIYGQDKPGFADGYDAVQAAPNSHRVIFENSLVRVLEVTVPPAGTTEPMHHHRWPSFFLNWDTGGKTPHVRSLRPDGNMQGQPSMNEPVHPGKWSVQWMEPEPMHAIHVVERPERAMVEPTLLRIEIKCTS